jgi:hypothetical protein
MEVKGAFSMMIGRVAEIGLKIPSKAEFDAKVMKYLMDVRERTRTSVAMSLDMSIHSGEE